MDFPIKNGGSFHSYVSLPEGTNCNQSNSGPFFLNIFGKIGNGWPIETNWGFDFPIFFQIFCPSFPGLLPSQYCDPLRQAQERSARKTRWRAKSALRLSYWCRMVQNHYWNLLESDFGLNFRSEACMLCLQGFSLIAKGLASILRCILFYVYIYDMIYV